MKIIFFVYQFSDIHIRLQPWKYIKEVVERLSENGHELILVTDSALSGNVISAKVRVVDRTKITPFRKSKLKTMIEQIAPDIMFWPLGAKSLLYVLLLKKYRNKIIGYFPGPIWTYKDAVACVRQGLLKEALQALLWAVMKATGGIKGFLNICVRFLVLSVENKQTLKNYGISEDIIVLAPAIHYKKDIMKKCPMRIEKVEKHKNILFMGWPKKLRGVYLLLDAFEVVAKHNGDIDLTILARGNRTREHDQLFEIVKKKDLLERITVISGFLPSGEVKRHIVNCDFGILPFIHVPADCPLSFLEFFAVGKPVITTDASGVSGLVADGRGLVAERNKRSLSECILKFASMDTTKFDNYSKKCIAYADEHNTWDAVVARIEDGIVSITGEL